VKRYSINGRYLKSEAYFASRFNMCCVYDVFWWNPSKFSHIDEWYFFKRKRDM